MKRKALAVKYTKGLKAPYILAKGEGYRAEELISIAQEHNIHTTSLSDDHSNLFTLEVDDYIPHEYFELMAELLSFVYKLGDSNENFSS